MKALIVTGTDTEVGKTLICGLLAGYLLQKGRNVITQKWIQTGPTSDIAVHLKLMQKKKKDFTEFLPHICPYNFKLPASPHLAAKMENKKINPAKIKNSFRKLTDNFDFVIVEATGGVLVPYNNKKLVLDIAKDLNLPAIIVTQNKLGAINHTLLTVEALKSRKIKIFGVIFNSCRERQNKNILKDNPKIIKTLTGEKILGTLAWSKDTGLLYKAFEPIGGKILREINGRTVK